MRRILAVTWLGLATATAVEPDEALSGGDTTVFQTGKTAFSAPLANLSAATRRVHVVGNSFFNKNWVVAPASTTGRDGLGPLFHERSCSGCHIRDGRGSTALFRLSIPGKTQNGDPVPDPVFGTQLAPRAIPGFKPEGDVRIEYEEVVGEFADGTAYSLRKPVYTPEFAAASDLMIGPRVPPAVFGVGLLEAVSEASILALAGDVDGISGRPNFVWNPEARQRQLGRFGWKANQATVRQQVAAAFFADIGITSSIHPEPPAEPEIDDRTLARVVTYQLTLAPPARRDVDDPVVRRGQTIFGELRCAVCHVPKLKTGDFEAVPELANQTIRPYTDLLLHDMGEDLADGRPDFEATGSEWRTPPLWGIGLVRVVNGQKFFLHDGRARNFEEAILWHGGEAEASAEAYRSLSADDRSALIAFLNSL